MSQIAVKLILTGARAGMTCQLGNFQFVEGATFVRGNGKDVDGKCTYLGRCYKAWPEGSQELEHFQRLDQERINGASKVDPPAQSGQTDAVSGRVQSRRGESAEVAAAAGTEPVDPARPDRSGGVSGGDGHQVSGNAEGEFRTGRIVESVKALDSNNDEHWTADGRPRMDAVEKAFGSADISRADVELALPSFNREVAIASAANAAR